METLVEQARAGSPDAFEKLVRLHVQALYRTGYAILRNDEDVADAVQDAVLSAWQKLGQLSDPQYFKTWLIRIMVNKCYTLASKRKVAVPLEQAPDVADEHAETPNLEWEEALDVLDERYRPAIVMYYAEGFKTTEIAELLDKPASTITTWLARGREQLTRYYRPRGSEGALV